MTTNPMMVTSLANVRTSLLFHTSPWTAPLGFVDMHQHPHHFGLETGAGSQEFVEAGGDMLDIFALVIATTRLLGFPTFTNTSGKSHAKLGLSNRGTWTH